MQKMKTLQIRKVRTHLKIRRPESKRAGTRKRETLEILIPERVEEGLVLAAWHNASTELRDGVVNRILQI